MDAASTRTKQDTARRFLSISLVLCMACAHTGSASPAERGDGGTARTRAVVLPVVWIPENPLDSDRIDALLVDRWREVAALDVVASPERIDSQCADDLGCLQRVGQQAGADKLMLYRVASLGPTAIIRAQSVDVGQATMEQTVQSVLEDESEGGVSDAEQVEAADEALLAATDQLAAFYVEPTAWYARPVVWITAGAAILAGTLSFFLLRGDDDPEPDTVVVPPAPR
ncbi:MAG: hypothetical protein AAFP04_09395 [Myxococcota bacterium]